MDVKITWDDTDSISHALNSNLYIYFQIKPKILHYVGMAYTQSVLTRLNQEIFDPLWIEKITNQFGRFRNLRVNVGSIEIMSEESVDITKSLIKDIEGLIIINTQPQINIKSKSSHKLLTTKELNIENYGFPVDEDILPQYIYSS